MGTAGQLVTGGAAEDPGFMSSFRLQKQEVRSFAESEEGGLLDLRFGLPKFEFQLYWFICFSTYILK